MKADGGEEARDLVRDLVERVRLYEEADGFRIEVRGELANILSLAAGGPRQAEILSQQIKMVAGGNFAETTPYPPLLAETSITNGQNAG